MGKFNYVPLKAFVPNDGIDKALFSQYSFLACGIRIQRDHVVVPAVPTMQRDPSLDIWQNIKPLKGVYRFEIAVRLPFFLPSLRGKNEYGLAIDGRDYAISNRHCEMVLENATDNIYLLGHYLITQNVSQQTQAGLVQVIMARSIVLTRFSEKGSCASECIENNFQKWIQILNKDISNMIQGMRYYMPKDSHYLPDCNGIGRLCPVHVICIGLNDKISSALTFVTHYNAYPMQAVSELSCDVDELEAFYNGAKNVDYSKLIFRKAIYLQHAGEYSVACILACTACERLLAEWLHEELVKRGLSRNRYDSAFNDLRFSQLLNTFSYFLLDMKNCQVKKMLGAINALRKLRNDIVHENKVLSSNDIKCVKAGLDAIGQLIEKQKP